MQRIFQRGESGVIVLDRTPFYAESGGQVGDTGIIGDGVNVFAVCDTQKSAEGVYMHNGTVEAGSISVGDAVTPKVDADVRNATMRNHTAAHLLQAALRKVLGTHVEQAGQLVNSKNVRFDFTHFSAMTSDEISAVEHEVNMQILKAAAVTCREMPIDEAKKLGAMALFGEKYGDVVRVVTAGDCSIELCGGTHTDNTSKLGLFKIVSEGSVAAGVRRIEGVTGDGVLDLLNKYIYNVKQTSELLKIGSLDELVKRVAQLVGENKEKDREIDSLRDRLAANETKELFRDAIDVNGVKVITAKVDGDADELRSMCDAAKADDQDVVIVVASINSEKGTVNFACG